MDHLPGAGRWSSWLRERPRVRLASLPGVAAWALRGFATAGRSCSHRGQYVVLIAHLNAFGRSWVLLFGCSGTPEPSNGRAAERFSLILSPVSGPRPPPRSPGAP